MQTHFLFDLMAEHPRFQEMLQEAKKPGAVIAASGLAGAQKMHLACALAEATGRPLLVLCESERAAAAAMEDVSALLGGGVSLFPAREITFYQEVAASREVACRRIETLHRLITGQTRAVVCPADALCYAAEGTELALTAVKITRMYIVSVAAQSPDETYRYVTRLENELTLEACSAAAAEVTAKAEDSLQTVHY